MNISSKRIAWGSVVSLGLGEFDYDLEPSASTRRVLVWRVPESMATDQYFTSVSALGQPPEIPPCLGRDALLLLDAKIPPTGEPTIRYAHPAVKAA